MGGGDSTTGGWAVQRVLGDAEEGELQGASDAVEALEAESDYIETAIAEGLERCGGGRAQLEDVSGGRGGTSGGGVE